MFPNQQQFAAKQLKCSDYLPAVADPNAANLVTWLNGATITNGTTPLPRDLTLANTYAAHSARWIFGSNTLSAVSNSPYPCFGGTSLSVPITGTSVLYSNTISSLSFGAGNFTIECWVRPDNTSTAIFRVIDKGGIGGASGAWPEYYILGSDGTTPSFPGKGFYFGASTTPTPATGGDINPNLQDPTTWFGTFTWSKWTFISVTRNGNNWYMHQDGQLCKSFTQAGTLYTSTRGLAVGSGFTNTWPSTVLRNRMSGYVRDLKIYNGIAKYGAGSYQRPVVPNV